VSVVSRDTGEGREAKTNEDGYYSCHSYVRATTSPRVRARLLDEHKSIAFCSLRLRRSISVSSFQC